MRRALVIGGTSFMGRQLVWRLVSQDFEVTILNRGIHPDIFQNHVHRIVVDRRSSEFAGALERLSFDAVVDFAAYNQRDVSEAISALQGRVGHYVFISSGSAYLAGDGINVPLVHPLKEQDYPAAHQTPPITPDDLSDWRYGMGKREAEAVLETAWINHEFPSTRLRLPIVNGLADPERRLESYLWRLRDGYPVIVPDGGRQITRHVYVTDVVHAIAQVLGDSRTFGHAYNLSQNEDIAVSDLISLLAERLGAPNRQFAVSLDKIQSSHLEVRQLSPFSGIRSSRLDPSLAQKVWGFSHRPLTQYLDAMVDAFLADTFKTPPENYQQREKEVAQARLWQNLSSSH